MILMSYGDSKNFWAIPKPARIPPQTPPAGGNTAEAGRIHIPSQLFRPAESAFLSKKVRANVRITPPYETCSELNKRSDFAEVKIALSISLPPLAEAVKSQSSPKLHERR